MASTMAKENRESIYKQLRKTVGKIIGQDAPPSVEQVINIVNDWKPKTDIVCLYVTHLLKNVKATRS
jgi:hypothetical protein